VFVANAEHIAIVKRGAEAVRKWRAENPNLQLDLRGADLTGENLAGVDLSKADLDSAELARSDLRAADLRGANLSWANLGWAKLSEADLTGADLSWSMLCGTDLQPTQVLLADLTGTRLDPFPWSMHLPVLWPKTPEHSPLDSGILELTVDIVRLRRLLWSEYDRFVSDATSHERMQEVQVLRGHFIAWICTFLPEIATPTFQASLNDFLRQQRDADDYNSHWWYKLLPLEVAAYSLSGYTDFLYYLRSCRLNIDHHNSALRTLVLECLSFAVPNIPFGDEELRRRVSHNLEISHWYCEWAAIVLLLGEGTATAKRIELARWLKEYRLNDDEREVLEKVLQTGSCVNTFFMSHFLRVATYVNLRLGTHAFDDRASIRDPDLRQLNLFTPELEKDLARLYWLRVTQHPLMNYSVCVLPPKVKGSARLFPP
jgi:hypothetical protein